MTTDYEYKVGGSLGENAPSYVTRQADFDLYHSLKAGEFCYIFNSRQMGKTSLIVRTMNKLQAEGFACTSLDFSVRGSRDIKSEQWYAGIVYKLTTNFNLGNPSDILRNWWQERGAIPPIERLEEFIETVLLASIQSKIIIFIDEIDSILSLGFDTGDFFALIRSCYEKRNFNPEYRRLTFALVGVAAPGDLIADKRRTPFNIGKAIQLEGFKDSEIEPLAKGFEGQIENPLALIQEILTWTGGQPFLTQKICRLIATDQNNVETVLIRSPHIASHLQDLIQKNIIENWESHDEPEHIKTIRDRMLLGEQIAGRFLGWYQQILLSGYIQADESIEQIKFRLTGLVVKQQDIIKVYNRIYSSVLNLTWVEKELRKIRPYSENFQAWVDSNYQDESRLLRGQALQDALQWATEKSLSSEDSRYLTASQELEKRELSSSLTVKEEESRILSAANETLTRASQKAKGRIRLGNIIFAASLVAAIFAAILAGIVNHQRQEAIVIRGLETSSAQLLRLPKSSFTLENLTDAMQSVIKLKKLVNNRRLLKDYPAISPVLALQTTLDNILEKNWLSGSDDIVFSPDGQTLATTSADNTAKLWNLKGVEIATFKHQGWVRNVIFSPDGQTVATASDDNTAKLWNLKGGEIATFQHQGWVRNVIFSPDGKTLATASDDNTAKLWNLKGREIATFQHQGGVRNVVFSPDGQTLATASGDSTAKLWNLKGEEIATLKHQDGVNKVVFSPDGQTLATASGDSTAKLWNLKGEEITTFKHQARVNDVVFSPDGQTLATASGSTAKLWSLKGREIATLPHQAGVNKVVFSLDGQTLATASDMNKVKLWNLNNWEVTTLEDQVFKVVFSPDGLTLATASVNNTAKLWNLIGREVITLKHQGWVRNVVFSPDGKTVATALDDSTAKLWNLNGGEIITLKHQAGVNKVVFSPNGETLATASDDKTAKLWNLKGEEIATLKHQGGVNKVVFSPNGETLATASDDKTAKLWSRWNLKGGEIATLKHQGGVINVVFSPDGQTLATASLDNTAKLWDLKGKEIATLKHQSWVNNAVFSPDGQTLATASRDSTATLWNLKGKEITTLKHRSWVNNVVFSPDGQTLATVSWDNTGKLWNLKGEEIITLKHQSWVNNVVFSPDGHTVATASNDNAVRFWIQTRDTWQQLAEYQGNDGFFSPDGKLIAITVDNSVQLRRVEGLDDLLARGCSWLQDYLANSTRKDLRKSLCPGK
ncbi:WD-repeat containing protein [Calothrix sp. NIES-4071]|nr:WD-repeat containing protein [Calothrix sp. NIES-4071]BAZ54970.1 WD-repeat containing protein [Calothrix sp. NIES-4105]